MFIKFISSSKILTYNIWFFCLIFFIYGITYYGLLLGLLFFIGILFFFLKKKYIVISLQKILILLFVQSIAFLFNAGDCWDAPGTYTFIEVLLKGRFTICSNMTTSVVAEYSYLILVLYIILLVYFLME